MRAHIINPLERVISARSWNGSIDQIYAWLSMPEGQVDLFSTRPIVNRGARLLFDARHFTPIAGLPRFALGQSAIMAGPCVVIGTDDAGKSLPSPFTVAQLLDLIEWLDPITIASATGDTHA